MKNVSSDKELYLHQNKNLFSYQRLCTLPRFETEACGNSSLRASSPGRSGGGAGKGRRTFKYVYGI